MQIFDVNTSTKDLRNYLRSHNIISDGEEIYSVEKAGEGNMNIVLRIDLGNNGFILKQSRPYVQKYPEVKAPLNRIKAEALFYETVQDPNLQEHLPQIFQFVPEDYILIMEDLGNGQDMISLYESRKVDSTILDTLVNLLKRIHASPVSDRYPKNLELRKLNHEHIFILPFLEGGAFNLNDIQSGLEDLARPYRSNNVLRKRITSLGDLYLSEGKTLLHGDFYPGSWVRAENKLYVLDPEFSYVGSAEFDLGVMIAHFVMILGTMDPLEQVLGKYAGNIDTNLIRKFAGTEIMRRLIGLAQLPMKRELSEKKKLLELGCDLILS